MTPSSVSKMKFAITNLAAIAFVGLSYGSPSTSNSDKITVTEAASRASCRYDRGRPRELDKGAMRDCLKRYRNGI